MKYIRTESGIYELHSTHSRSSKFYYPTKHGFRVCQRQNKNCKLGDVVEELVDVYVIKGEYGQYLVYIDELDGHAMGQTKEMLLSGQLEAYGAIWIFDSNGAPTLKSVAKANKKGELELL